MQIIPFRFLIIMAHFVYIIYSETANRFYIGETCEVVERINQHNTGFYGSAFSKQASDWELFWSLECQSRNQALRIEKHIKEMRNRKFYENLYRYPEIAQKLLIRFPS